MGKRRLVMLVTVLVLATAMLASTTVSLPGLGRQIAKADISDPSGPVAWAQSMVGLTTFPLVGGGYQYARTNCAQFVANAYGARDAGFYCANDLCNWESASGQLKTMGTPTIGSLCFYDCGSDGHVAIYIGGQNVVSAGCDTIQVQNYNNCWGLPYIGYGAPYPGWPGRPSVEPPPPPPSFSSYIVLQNPKAQTASVTLAYMMEGGGTKQENITVSPTSRETLNLDDAVGTGKTFSTMVSSSIPIIAERPMYFNYKGTWTGGHDVIGANIPSPTFYFAEGTCRPNFDTYFTIQNPGSVAANVALTYMKGDGTTAMQALSIPANSRATLHPADVLGTGDDDAHDFSTKVNCTNGQKIIAERPMYFNYNGVWSGGSDVVGETLPSSTFYFAEGTCRPNFDPYFCIQNPGSTTADVSLTYMRGNGTTTANQVIVPPHSRSTVLPSTTVGTGNDAAHDFSTVVACTNGQKIIAERPMYFNYQGSNNYNWTGGSDVVGATSLSSTFYFAEGTTRSDFDEWLSLQNPGSKTTDVTLTYMKGDGTKVVNQVAVPPHSRSTVMPRKTMGTGNEAVHDFSTVVTCTNGQKIIAERSMYFNYQGSNNYNWTGGSDVVGATARNTTWYFAEGYTGN